MKRIRLMRNCISRYSSGNVYGWQCQVDARDDANPGKWGGFAAPPGSGLGEELSVPHTHDSIDSAIRSLNVELHGKGVAVSADGSTNMTVAQLIDALKHMPPDAPVITHANNHSTGLGTNNDQRVASRVVYGREVVIIGNWSSYNVNGWEKESIPSEVWSVKTWGKRAGLLVRGSIKLAPEKETIRTSVTKESAHYVFTDEAE